MQILHILVILLIFWQQGKIQRMPRKDNIGQANSASIKIRVLLATTNDNCMVCSDKCEKLSSCPVFEKMSNSDKWAKVKSKRGTQ